ncbi:MAG: hypothetical protein V4506_14505 [Bacteroidota bacterium]
MKIQTVNPSGYGALICSYFETHFPKITKPSSDNLLEILSTLIIGTKENRYGPTPKPEYQVEIRKVILGAIAADEPIPFLIPWGGRKAHGYDSIDVAEVSALRQVINLDEAIKMFYPKGLRANIRVEDTGALWLYQGEDENAVERYTNDFKKLVHILKGDTILLPIAESALVDKSQYFENSRFNSDVIYNYIEESDFTGKIGFGESYFQLEKIGWKGEIPFEQRNHYRSMYKRINPELTDQNANRMLADYLGAAKARVELNGTAKPKSNYGYIQLSFTPPVPGSPASISSTNVYWRTVPLSQGATHISPWRAKGYLAIAGTAVKSKIISYGNTPVIESLECDAVMLTSETGMSVEVRVDYLVQEVFSDPTISGIVFP